MAENTPGGHDVGTPVRATDPEGRAVTYRLSGRDASAFTLDEDNGQLRTRNGVDYNYEVKNRYAVTVEAADEQGGRPSRSRLTQLMTTMNDRTNPIRPQCRPRR